MKRIRFERFKSFDDMEYEALPADAVRLREAKDMKQFYLRIIPGVFVLAIILVFISSKHYYDSGIMDSGLNPIIRGVVILMMVCPGFVLHELIHAVLFPPGSEITVYVAPKMGAMFCYATKAMSRLRFIILSIAPNLVLGIIPFIVLMIIPARDTYLYSCLRSFTLIMILGGIGDYYNIKNILFQVPGSASIQMKGWETYWFESKRAGWRK